MPAAKTPAKKGAKSRKAVPKAKPKTNAKRKASASKAVKVVKKVVKSTGSKAPSEYKLFSELEVLADFIKKARTDIAALNPDEVKDDFLPTAADELDAIVAATADATNAIMDATEIIEDVTSGLEGEAADKMMMATSGIYEACGFQDITGQRISKVVSTLQDIELKVDSLISAFSDGKKTPARKKAKKKKEVTDEDLLNGPQATDKAKSQAEINDLLASFD
ncbi:MAG: chemotaxis protein CheZ [Rhodospirillaceae bacterium]|jgi:chemotaxis protein CheZ|nr:chemotaxis protein CheZ [Rhodospirillaceae bacterium]MBT4218969.1 chemotaxis protein CheZ [Rhodospirillaceae bacterium]MBT4464264.1 chemotaxis protein CheZ [Rhodospirillaceae bacterium]MBT5308058.1 chemotaxis protein CheZ [Rhodospirillaceae bacterium]MBT7356100.1 chemotaxis protein CheZ [Rhodospirillaceae bacterium]